MKKILKKIIYFILRLEARIIIWKYKPKILAVTGSVGKTSTKDAAFSVLSRFAYVRKSEKNYNTQIGLPLAILGVPNGWGDIGAWFRNLAEGLKLIFLPNKYPEWLILEVGVGKPGDMKTTAWFKTDVVIMTMINETPVHVEFFDSKDHLVEEKTMLIDTLKEGGVLILNKDNKIVAEMKNKTKKKTLTYGFSDGADIAASEVVTAYGSLHEPTGLVWRVESEGHSLPVSLSGVFGKSHAYAALAALAFAKALDLNLVQAIEALKDYTPAPGRMRLLEGKDGTFIIDDSYNSSPPACQSALETLSEVNGNRRKIAVLGDMLELGRHTKEEHEKIGGLVKDRADVLVVVGPRAQHIKDGALSAGMIKNNIFEFKNSREAGSFLSEFITPGDLILVKGSQSIRMERAIEPILKEPKKKEDLLVRQEPQWLAKE